MSEVHSFPDWPIRQMMAFLGGRDKKLFQYSVPAQDEKLRHLGCHIHYGSTGLSFYSLKLIFWKKAFDNLLHTCPNTTVKKKKKKRLYIHRHRNLHFQSCAKSERKEVHDSWRSLCPSVDNHEWFSFPMSFKVHCKTVRENQYLQDKWWSLWIRNRVVLNHCSSESRV